MQTHVKTQENATFNEKEKTVTSIESIETDLKCYSHVGISRQGL